MFNTKRIEGRECGECSVCCEVLGVVELEKPNYIECTHQCNVGCGIYASRPQSCRDYECLWRQGWIGKDESDRPDNSGVMLDFTRIEGKTETLVVWEWDSRFINNERLKYWLKKIAQKIQVKLCRRDGSMFYLSKTRTK